MTDSGDQEEVKVCENCGQKYKDTWMGPKPVEVGGGESSSSSKDKRLGPTKTTSKQSKGGGEPPKTFDLVTNSEPKYVRDEIQKCSVHDHVQQVAYSTYHDALTQICFNCRIVRTNLEEVFDPECRN